ncbi:MAG: SdpI family protein [Bacteroidota bacterium]|nr:SdpI family protein [Bacteroidota bacterium]
METLKKDWLSLIILVIPFLFIGFLWDRFPEQIATHFNLEGEADDYSGKVLGLFMIPLVNIGLYLLFKALPLLDPSGKTFALYYNKFRIIQLIIHCFMVLIFSLICFHSLGYSGDLQLPMLYSILLIFLLLGNYMGNIRKNYFIGIRTPWTLANVHVWTLTHRLAAKVWVGASLLTMAIIPFIPTPHLAFVVYLGVIILIPVVYSFIIFKKVTHES